MVKTIRAWFEELPDDIKEKAFKNTKKHDLSGKSNSLSNALGASFRWSETPEGYDYWENIYLNQLDNEE